MFRSMVLFRNVVVAAVYLALLSHAATSHAVSTLSLISAGDSTYQLQGAGLEGVTSFDITVNYDPLVFSAPRVVQGSLISAAMLAVNSDTPGIIRISAVMPSPLKDSGEFLTVTFIRIADGQGVSNLAARFIDSNGKRLSPQVRLATGSNASDEGSASDSVAREDTASESGSTPSAVAVIVPSATDLPDVRQDRIRIIDAESFQPEDLPLPAQPATTRNASEATQDKSKSVYTEGSILDRFRGFHDEHTMKAYLKLFDQEPPAGFQQDPAVALADGVGKVTVRFISTPERERTSDLALMGAKLIASRRDPDSTNTWIVIILPEKGNDRVTLSVPQKDLLMVYQVTIAPKVDIDLDKSGVANEADFVLFLNDRGTQKAPKFDLNRDGVRDYRDEFIFTANYLAAEQSRSGQWKQAETP